MKAKIQLLFLWMVSLFGSTLSLGSTCNADTGVLKLKKVTIRNWKNSTRSVSAFFHHLSEPVVIRYSALAQSWPRWTPSFLASEFQIESMYGIYQHSNPYFGPYFDKSRPLRKVTAIKPENPYLTNVYANKTKFVEIFSDEYRGPPYYAFSTDPNRIRKGLEQTLDLKDVIAFNPKESSVNLWVGMTGGITPCHFDGHHNV